MRYLVYCKISRHTCINVPIGGGTKGVDNEHVCDGTVERGVTERYEVNHDVTGQRREEVGGHALPKVQEKLFNLREGGERGEGGWEGGGR